MKKTFFAGLFLALGTLVVNAQQVEPAKAKKAGKKHTKKVEAKAKEEVAQMPSTTVVDAPQVPTEQSVPANVSTTGTQTPQQPTDKK